MCNSPTPHDSVTRYVNHQKTNSLRAQSPRSSFRTEACSSIIGSTIQRQSQAGAALAGGSPIHTCYKEPFHSRIVNWPTAEWVQSLNPGSMAHAKPAEQPHPLSSRA